MVPSEPSRHIRIQCLIATRWKRPQRVIVIVILMSSALRGVCTTPWNVLASVCRSAYPSRALLMKEEEKKVSLWFLRPCPYCHSSAHPGGSGCCLTPWLAGRTQPDTSGTAAKLSLVSPPPPAACFPPPLLREPQRTPEESELGAL